jgi:GntR family transcriptional regulator/MocR family aminotransferase
MARVPVDHEGLDVERGRALAPHATAAFVTPSHQYPLGMPMSLRRRTALLEWARASGAWIVEDDYDSEVRYAGHPFPSMQGLEPDRVVYLGTFSKVLFPSLRLGYAIVPGDLVRPFVGARMSARSRPCMRQALGGPACCSVSAGTTPMTSSRRRAGWRRSSKRRRAAVSPAGHAATADNAS